MSDFDDPPDDPVMPADPDPAAEESMFSVVDIFILSLIVGFVIYWFIFRKRKEELPIIKKLTVAPAVVQTGDPSFINRMKSSGRNVVVFYGSQTGTAEEFAGRLSKDAIRYGMKGMLADPEECDMEELVRLSEIENSLAVFCMATYGEGDPTDNCQEFFDWLENGDADLTGVNYAVFGLGNKTYEHYNASGKATDKRLESLGATRVFELGLGDDDGNIEEDFISWRERFWPTVCEHYGVQATGDEVSMRQYYVREHTDTIPEKVFSGEVARWGSYRTQKPPYDIKNPYLAAVTVNRGTHPAGDRYGMHLELDISGSRIRYEAGDHVAVYPVNDPDIVEAIGDRLGIDLGICFTLHNVDDEATKKHPFPCPCTYRTALLHYIDITSLPHKHILKELADYASVDTDKEFLLNISANTPEGKTLYSDWVTQDHRTILDILTDLPSLNPPIDHLCELLPRLQPRFYSISSSPKVHPESIHITAVLVEYSTRIGRDQKGVATSWLKNKVKTEGIKVPIFVRKSQFRLPFKPATPILMIGPGTGLAPFRGFLQERDWARKEGKPVGECVLYFGCRHKAEDYIYQEELEEYQSNGTLSQLHLAFSRDQEHKVYVQHLMDQNKQEIWGILSNGGHIYVCGDARNMSRDVHSSLETVAKECGEMTQTQAEEFIKRLQTKGRYSQDVWS